MDNLKIPVNTDISKPLVVWMYDNDNKSKINHIITQLNDYFILSYDNQYQNICSIINDIKNIQKDYKIDSNRIYLISTDNNISSVAWAIISNFSRIFAGCIICGGNANPYLVRQAKFLPILALNNKGRNNAKECIYSLCSIGSTNAKFIQNENEITVKMFDWLFSQDKTMQYEINWIKQGIWNIESGAIDSFYLIEGETRSLLVDTGMGGISALSIANQLTKLPISLALTHAHGDHMLYADEFDKVYISHKEKELPRDFLDKMMPNKNYNIESFINVDENTNIDIGGNIIEVITAFGHTPGSVVYVDHKHKCMFCGDAFGSGMGVLMAIPGNLTLSEYKENLQQFLKKTSEYKDYVLYGGHWIQERGEVPDTIHYNPLTFEIIEDMVELCEKILNNDKGLSWIKEGSNWLSEDVFYVKYKKAGMWVAKSRIK